MPFILYHASSLILPHNEFKLCIHSTSLYHAAVFSQSAGEIYWVNLQTLNGDKISQISLINL